MFILVEITSNYGCVPIACHAIYSDRLGTYFSTGAFLLVEETTGSTVISTPETIIDICVEALIAERKFKFICFF
jgi:hypothetical protein